MFRVTTETGVCIYFITLDNDDNAKFPMILNRWTAFIRKIP